jgi:hypothetical protein
MIRVIFIFVVGLGLGYWVGFKDARMHKEDVVARTVARVGGQTRRDVGVDVDQKMQKVEQDSDR